MQTYTDEGAIALLARHISESRSGFLGLITVQVPTVAGAPTSYSDLELATGCGEVTPSPETGLNPPSRIKFVVRGRDGHGPFVFVWPKTTVDRDQPACNGLAVESISISG